jgi:hypothetical protein
MDDESVQVIQMLRYIPEWTGVRFIAKLVFKNMNSLVLTLHYNFVHTCRSKGVE